MIATAKRSFSNFLYHDPTWTRLLLGILAAVIGLTYLAPGDTFSISQTYAKLAQFPGENYLGMIFFGYGAAEIVLWLVGCGPMCTIFMGILGLGLWMFHGMSMVLTPSPAPSVVGITYIFFALASTFVAWATVRREL